MSAEKQVSKRDSFWSPLRVASTVTVLTLVALFGASSCNSNDEPANREPAPKANIVPANPGASAPANPAAPAPVTVSAALPVTVRDAELRAVNGKPIKLGDY